MQAKKHRSERKAKPRAHVVGRSLRPVVRFLCQRKDNRELAYIRKLAAERFGKCSDLERIGARWTFTFRRHKCAPETVVAWLIMLCSLEVVDFKSNPTGLGTTHKTEEANHGQ